MYLVMGYTKNSQCALQTHTSHTHLHTQSSARHTNTFAWRCNTLQHTATHCSILQHTAAYCNTLQHTAAQILPADSVAEISLPLYMYSVAEMSLPTYMYRGTALQHIAAHYSTLQHTAAHANHCKSLQQKKLLKRYCLVKCWCMSVCA